MKTRSTLILLIVVLDAMGIGMAFPTMPALVGSLVHGATNASIARHYGWPPTPAPACFPPPSSER